MERALERAVSGVASRSLSASTRAAALADALAERAGRARARASRRGYTTFQLAEPVMRIRSAPALIDRSAAVATPERASTAGASMLSVTITPWKPSCRRSSPVTMARDCEAIRLRVEGRIERVREHHERHAAPRSRRGTGTRSCVYRRR